MHAHAQNALSSLVQWTSGLFSLERLLVAAAAGSAASFLFRAVDAASPGMPASAILEQARVPFFEHMLAATFVTLLAWMGAGPLLPSVRRWPALPLGIIVVTSVGAAVLQWFFPNY